MPRLPYRGPALFSLGFRPFFLLAGLFGAVTIPLWLCVWTGRIVIAGPFNPVDWHIHEMLFGYTGAVVAGFLFTAVPNWTGRMPARGLPLGALVALWLAGRLAVAGALGLGSVAVMIVDTGFFFAIALMIAVEVIAGRNWRNIRVVVPVTLYGCANLWFHLAAFWGADTGPARRAGFMLVLILITLIGGRIIPSFTRNWMAGRGASRLPVPANRFDAICVGLTAVALAVWVALPDGWATGAALLLASGLQAVRMARWRGTATLASPLLMMLHLSYAMLALGLAAAGFGAIGLVAPLVGYHLLGIGAVGGMTLAVMMRVAMGHTGRPLEAGRALTLAFALVLIAAAIRAAAGTAPPLLFAAGLIWSLGFAIFCLRVGPWLMSGSATPRKASRAKRAAV